MIGWIFLTLYLYSSLSLSFSLSLSLSISPYHPSLSVGLPNYIIHLHRDVVNKFLLIGQHWYVQGL